MAADWKKGTGTYIGDDGSTYVVKDDGGQAIMVFVARGTVGRGNATRDIAPSKGALVVSARSGRGLGKDLPEIVLREGMTGWWRPGGEVFSEEEPAQVDDRPVRMRGAGQPPHQNVASGAKSGSVTTLAVSSQHEPPALSSEGLNLVANLLRDFRVRKGPGGIVVLSGHDGEVVVPDDKPNMFGTYLESRYRHVLLRLLRDAPGVTDLDQVSYKKFSDAGYVRGSRKDEVENGWYWCDGAGNETYIGHRREALRLNVASQRKRGLEMAVNNSNKTPTAVLGALTSGDFVYPRAHAGSDTEVLVQCPEGGARDVTLLLATLGGERDPRRTNLALVSYRITHTKNGRHTFDIADRDPHQPEFIVARDNKGGPRIFRRF